MKKCAAKTPSSTVAKQKFHTNHKSKCKSRTKRIFRIVLLFSLVACLNYEVLKDYYIHSFL